jgi:transcriptional regulator with XRE-family HTH domain
MTLGDRIKRRRTALRLTQQELSERAQVRRVTIVELEVNRRATVNSDILRRLARALGCTTDYLVGLYADEDDDDPRRPRRRVLAAPS